MLDQALRQIGKWIRRLALFKYSVFLQLSSLLFILFLAYPYYENNIMKVQNDTGWVNSPNNNYQARMVMKRRYSSHLVVQLILRSNIEALDWYEIMNVKLIDQVVFKNWPPNDTALRWKDDRTIDVLYYSAMDRPFLPVYGYKDRRIFSLEIL